MNVANARDGELRYYEHKEEMEAEKLRNMDTGGAEELVSRDQTTRGELKIAIVLHHESGITCRFIHESRLGVW